MESQYTDRNSIEIIFRAQPSHATQLKDYCVEQHSKLFVQSMTMGHLGKRNFILTNDLLDWYITVGHFSGHKAAICTRKISISTGELDLWRRDCHSVH